MSRFAGRTILVTGGASGIGAATVRRVFSEGANVAIADINQSNLEALVAELGGGPRLLAMSVDVSDRLAVNDFVAKARSQFGTLNGLVNCAGIRGVGSVADFDPERWHKVLGVNLDGTFYTCQAFVQAVKDDKTPRAIVNLSSGAGVLGVPNRLAYVASKFAVGGITRAMAPELGPFGIRVNAVAAGITRTPLMAFLYDDPEAVKRMEASNPLGRGAEPEEIAAAITFLLSDDASFMTGAVMSVDGGQTAVL